MSTKINPDSHPDHIIRDRSKELEQAPIMPSFSSREESLQIQNELSRFFVPGWKGESLISKDVKSFIKIIKEIHQDVKSHFLNSEKFSKRQKIAIFEEFLSFAEFKTLQCSRLDNHANFWQEITNPKSEYKPELKLFIDIFSFRLAVIYLFKVRFINTLQEQTQGEFDLKNIYYPNSFLTSVFKSASSRELKAKSFEQNIFSWYRPSQEIKKSLLEFTEISTRLKITEIIKTISVQSEEILQQKTDYSHSLSHKQFGLFLNCLLINFPIWLNTLGKQCYNPYVIPKDNMEIISCKFAGDYLESLGLSHWLAQDHNKEIKWEQILCPDFKNDDFLNGLYLKNVSELQFLTFLAEIANKQDRDPISFICNVVNSHLYNRKNSNEVQKSLLLNDTALNNSTYDRVILNLVNYPKNNPQHFLFSRILEQKNYLKENGFIYVLTSKKLFVPSQKQKVQQLLNQLKIEGMFDLSAVSGKGEIGSYIYIFSNREDNLVHPKHAKKHNCINFRYTANLKSFHEYDKLTNLTQKFLHKNIGDLPALSQLYDGQTRLEFFQDAIIGGQLIHSTNKDASNITHPSFFRRLMSLCNPLDFFFDLKNIDFNDSYQTNQDTFFEYVQGFNQDMSPYVIIVDQRLKDEVKIEIIKSNLLEVKAYEYGHASCTYFYAFKKWPHINMYAIKDFLESEIGKQIINLTFNNEIRKVKGNLNKLLIPKFYINDKDIPSHIKEGLKFLEHKPEDLLNMHPSHIEKTFAGIECFIPNIINEYPAQILNMFTLFKRSVQKSIEKLGSLEDNKKVNFNNPLLKSPLLLSKTYPLYPDNDEVYVEFSADNANLIHANLERTKVIQQNQYEQVSYGIELYGQGSKIITLYSDEAMVNFLEFLLSNTKNVPISKILQGVSIPRLEDLKSIISSYQSLRTALLKIQEKLSPLQNRLLGSTIAQAK